MAEHYITSKELISTLKISSQELITIEQFFDAIPDDEWELLEGKDYRVVAGNGLREYTTPGAYTLARYLDATQKQGFWEVIKEWFSHRKREVRRAFVRKKILDNCSSLVKRNDIFFVSRSDVVAIFGTKPSYLKKMSEIAQRAEQPLLKGQDYDEFIDEGGLHYSLAGIDKLSQVLKTSLTKKNRREWCTDVGEVIRPQVKDIVDQIIKRDKGIQKAICKVKRDNDNTCQVTGKKPDKVNNFKIAAHHLYSRNSYPHLADVDKNLITLTCEVHEQFHQYMGGYGKPCTIDDFIKFVEQYYPSSNQVVICLNDQKRVLGNPEPVNQRKPHVLYLPVSRVL
ncbi:hypothetical protein [Myxacorys almedinensis]|uniref:Uncharacterized protein n=1 Tax=Myxacorys almedinensis A TaxID=2690445 RepID=A0A8J7Z4F9_9CYAN|nr:hypothetical protein [Myxacorys almedinensis]NDJ19150.1 hypothetical protein [Myxacorys almedinensis A]